MKKRLGFVSNSSSSSFAIAYKEDGLDKLNLPCEHPLLKRIDFKNVVLKCRDVEYKTIEECIDYHDNDIELCPNKILDAIKDGFTIIEGRFSDDPGDCIERFLCDLDIEYDSVN